MLKHFKQHHKHLLPDKTQTRGISGAIKPSQWTAKSQEYKDFVTALAKWMAIDKQPTNIVSGAGFQEFCAQYMPRFPGTTPVTVSKYLVALSNAQM